MAKSIFVNYRRGDGSGSAGRLFDLLSHNLAGTRIFMDVDALEPGVDFIGAIDEQLAGCNYFIAVIGPNWTNAQRPDGSRRLDDPADYVRVEIEAALRRGIRVVPVLVEGASMPRPDELPQSLRPFAQRNAFELSHNKFASDVRELSGVIKRNLGIEATQSRLVGASSATPMSWSDTLLSFRGRLPRKQFWAWSLILFGASLILQSLLLLLVGESIQARFFHPEQVRLNHHALVEVGTLPIAWCSFALLVKRFHDFNVGRWGPITVFLALAVYLGFSALYVASSQIDAVLTPSEKRDLHAMFMATGTLFAVMWLFAAAVPGTPGPNRFGPEPAAKRK